MVRNRHWNHPGHHRFTAGPWHRRAKGRVQISCELADPIDVGSKISNRECIALPALNWSTMVGRGLNLNCRVEPRSDELMFPRPAVVRTITVFGKRKNMASMRAVGELLRIKAVPNDSRVHE